MAVIDPVKLPFGGESILVSRMKKLAPEMVFISLLPARVRFNVEPYAFVRAIPGKDYDWRFLKRLSIFVVCNQEHANIGVFEKLCKEAYPVKVWFHDEQRGFDVMYLPTPESIEREDSALWDWRLDFSEWTQFENAEWSEWIERAECGVAHV